MCACGHERTRVCGGWKRAAPDIALRNGGASAPLAARFYLLVPSVAAWGWLTSPVWMEWRISMSRSQSRIEAFVLRWRSWGVRGGAVGGRGVGWDIEVGVVGLRGLARICGSWEWGGGGGNDCVGCVVWFDVFYCCGFVALVEA